MANERSYDFIVVGGKHLLLIVAINQPLTKFIGGPAGCTLAASLASLAKKPTRQLDYSRGKGIGGGSSINFGLYTIETRDDYNQWAAEVDDDTFAWNEMQARIKRLETFAGKIDIPENQKYGHSEATDHSSKGGLHVGYTNESASDLAMVLDASEEAGVQRNLDHNSGNPLGFGLCINSACNGKRSTAADLLTEVSDNLVIVYESTRAQRNGLYWTKRRFRESRPMAENVGFIEGLVADFASKDVILSAGSLEIPKILMHSGIGPADQLSNFNISVVHDLSAVG
ncbi:oxidoreductase [Penicillium samsonianum]|uniref:oxidoreductase n=1 Tax=Penicillium samsonianum TaxID=1882272 RepID=UPI00254953C7|nr:oxidoreductase [Penicillium samsonianum]KAJ6118056.1 oxidoreductase [Penicillium samsonianum]